MNFNEMNDLETLMVLSFLKEKRDPGNLALLESSIADGDMVIGEIEFKNVCAKVSTALADRVDQASLHLGISKRYFLECAMVQALETYENVFKEMEMDKFYTNLAAAQAREEAQDELEGRS